jgi:hypothetical protein
MASGHPLVQCTPCGPTGAPCCPHQPYCDETLVCSEGFCSAPSTPAPSGDCAGGVFQPCCGGTCADGNICLGGRRAFCVTFDAYLHNLKTAKALLKLKQKQKEADMLRTYGAPIGASCPDKSSIPGLFKDLSSVLFTQSLGAYSQLEGSASSGWMTSCYPEIEGVNGGSLDWNEAFTTRGSCYDMESGECRFQGVDGEEGDCLGENACDRAADHAAAQRIVEECKDISKCPLVDQAKGRVMPALEQWEIYNEETQRVKADFCGAVGLCAQPTSPPKPTVGPQRTPKPTPEPTDKPADKPADQPRKTPKTTSPPADQRPKTPSVTQAPSAGTAVIPTGTSDPGDDDSLNLWVPFVGAASVLFVLFLVFWVIS